MQEAHEHPSVEEALAVTIGRQHPLLLGRVSQDPLADAAVVCLVENPVEEVCVEVLSDDLGAGSSSEVLHQNESWAEDMTHVGARPYVKMKVFSISTYRFPFLLARTVNELIYIPCKPNMLPPLSFFLEENLICGGHGGGVEEP